MSEATPIEWCDSAVNPVMGCDGCELWQPDRDIRICYAGTLHGLRGGNPGYAKDFLQPETFAGRMAAAARWSDLRGIARPGRRDNQGKWKQKPKPWLDGRPRHIFISDMGDALSASVTFEFLLAEIIAAVTSAKGLRHIWMWLTKQPKRMAQFAEWLAARGIAWPVNLWAGTSLTEPQYVARLDQLRRVPAATRFLSIEPQAADVGMLDLRGIALAIMGGESGPRARPYDIAWTRALIRQCDAAGTAVFVKQLGAHIVWDGASGPGEHWPAAALRVTADGNWRVLLRDPKGGDWSEWPADLRRREWPEVSHG